MKVLVTGSAGQVGQALQYIQPEYPDVTFYFADSTKGDVTDKHKLELLFTKVQPDFCINAAAYTAVDKAESEPERAVAINVTGAANIAEVCKSYNCVLLHISTDFVFDGKKTEPYTEEDETNPQSVYGATKRDGELKVQAAAEKYFIIRTSWVYSQFGNNFMKTMLRLAGERSSLNVVNDQVGTPTHAVDLARALMQIVVSGVKSYGVYNFSNEGQCSWFDFADEIFRINNIAINLQPIPTTAYPTPAKRPFYSVLDKSKFKAVFGITVKDWKEALAIHQP